MTRLHEFLGIRARETEVFGWFFLFNVCWGLVAAFGGSAGESLFVKQWGVDWLPLFFILGDLSVMGGAVVYASISSEVGPQGLFRVLLTGFLCLSAGMFFAYQTGTLPPGSALGSLLVYWTTYFFIELGWMHFFNFQRRYLDVQQGKRLLARVLAGYSAGIVAGGIAVVLLLQAVSVYGLLGFWALAVAASFLAIEGLTTRLTVLPGGAREEAGRREVDTRQLPRYPLALWILAFTAVSYVTMRVFELDANTVFSRVYPSSDALAGFYGSFCSVARSLGVAVQVFLIPWTIEKYGLTRAMAIYGLFTCASGVALLATDGMGSAVAARFAHSTLAYNIESPVLILLAGSLPRPIADRVNVVAIGWVRPMASVLVSLFLLALMASGGQWALGWLSGALGLAVAAALIPLRRLYAREIVAALKAGEITPERLDELRLASLPPHFYAQLRPALASSNPEVVQLGLALLCRCGDGKSREMLAEFYDTPARSADRAFLLRMLKMHGLPEELELVERGLASNEPELLAAAVGAVGRLPGGAGAERVRGFVSDPDERVRCEAARTLAQSGDRSEELVRVLNSLIESHDAGVVEGALEALSFASPGHASRLFLRFFAHPDPRIRARATRLAAETGPEAVEETEARLVSSLTDPAAEVRAAGVDALGRLGSRRAPELIVSALGDPSGRVVETARRQLRALLPTSRLAIQGGALDRANSPEVRHNALDLVAASGPAEHLVELGTREVDGAFHLVAVRHAVGTAGDESVAGRFFHSVVSERVLQRSLLAVHAVAALKGSELYPVLARRLGSRDARLQSQAIEALTNLEEQEITPHLLRILEPTDDFERVEYARGRLGIRVEDTSAVALQVYRDRDPFLLAAWLELMRERDWRELLDRCPPFENHPHPLVRESYARATSTKESPEC